MGEYLKYFAGFWVAMGFLFGLVWVYVTYPVPMWTFTIIFGLPFLIMNDPR